MADGFLEKRLAALEETRLQPGDGGGESGLLDLAEMLEHYVEVAQGAELAAEGAGDAEKWALAAAGEDGVEEIDGGFEAAGGDAGIVNGVDVFALDGLGDQLSQLFYKRVEIVKEGRFVGDFLVRHRGGILAGGGG